MKEKIDHLVSLGMSKYDAIRKLVEEGTPQAEIARALGVSRQRVFHIVHGGVRAPYVPRHKPHDFFYYARIHRVTCSKCGMGLDYMNERCRGRQMFGPTNLFLADLLAAARAATLADSAAVRNA